MGKMDDIEVIHLKIFTNHKLIQNAIEDSETKLKPALNKAAQGDILMGLPIPDGPEQEEEQENNPPNMVAQSVVLPEQYR